MTPNIIDNFLDPREFDYVKNAFSNLEYSPVPGASGKELDEDIPHWNYYSVKMIYLDDEPVNETWGVIKDIFLPKFHLACQYKTMFRVKVNFYPYGETFHRHPYHIDQDFSHQGAIFALNTCNGFTEFEDGTKIDSVENRLFLFDPSIKHRSTNTTNAMGRFNINFNFF